MADELPIIDPEIFASLEVSVGDASAVAGMVGIFLDSLPDTVAAIAARAPSQLDSARRAAHQLKGNAGMFGALALADACREFELAIENRRYEELRDRASEIETAAADVEAWMRDRWE